MSDYVILPPPDGVDERQYGAFPKFKVERMNGTSAPGKKHDGCDVFVLDITHDPFVDLHFVGYVMLIDMALGIVMFGRMLFQEAMAAVRERR